MDFKECGKESWCPLSHMSLTVIFQLWYLGQTAVNVDEIVEVLNVLNYGDNWGGCRGGHHREAVLPDLQCITFILQLFFTFYQLLSFQALVALKSCFWCFLHSFTQPKDVKEIKALTLLTFSLCKIFLTCFLSLEHSWSRKRYILQAQNFFTNDCVDIHHNSFYLRRRRTHSHSTSSQEKSR